MTPLNSTDLSSINLNDLSPNNGTFLLPSGIQTGNFTLFSSGLPPPSIIRNRRELLSVLLPQGFTSTPFPPTNTVLNATSKPFMSFDPGSRTDINLYWQMPAALVLISLKWWENFVGEDRRWLKLFQVNTDLNMLSRNLNF